MPTINAVHSVARDSHPDARLFFANITLDTGETCDDSFVCYLVTSYPEGQAKSLNQLFQEWLEENEGSYDLLPFVMTPPNPDAVNRERDRRIDGGFTFGGVLYQSDTEARENIAGAAQLAFAAIVQGAEAGDLHWHGEPADFEWIAFDDTRTSMDAHTMFAFGQAALAHKRTHIFAANDLKKLEPIPADFAADTYWP